MGNVRARWRATKNFAGERGMGWREREVRQWGGFWFLAKDMIADVSNIQSLSAEQRSGCQHILAVPFLESTYEIIVDMSLTI